MKKVYYKTLDRAVRELWKEFRKKSYGRVEIYDETDFDEKIVKLGVNWAACGTVSAEEAVEFAKNLTEAAQAVSTFKYNGWEVVYSEEEAYE